MSQNAEPDLRVSNHYEYIRKKQEPHWKEKKKAAKILGISIATLYRKIKKSTRDQKQN
ncbi:helix-turn-helix domain-containing protein [Shigella sp. FC1967]|uniref:helix-turn-helix domain-containing protein n=1 Tax=Shigella sp. FC1967 TaxID=1898041 RepID=UPI0010084529